MSDKKEKPRHPKMVLGVSTSFLFDMSEPDAVYRAEGPEGYAKYMRERANDPLPFGRGIETLETALKNPKFFEIVLCSRNDPITALRASRTLDGEGLTPERAFFTSGKSPVPYLEIYGIKQFHTVNEEDAEEAHRLGIVLPSLHGHGNERVVHENTRQEKENVIALPQKPAQQSLKPVYDENAIHHVITDLDGVFFGPEAEAFFQANGLQAYHNHERHKMKQPLTKGAAFEVLKTYDEINKAYAGSQKPFVLSAVTARGFHAMSRAIETLHIFDIEFNGETHFTAGGRGIGGKENVLRVMRQADEKMGVTTEFYDDQRHNIEQAIAAGINVAGQVPSDLFKPDEKGPA